MFVVDLPERRIASKSWSLGRWRSLRISPVHAESSTRRHLDPGIFQYSGSSEDSISSTPPGGPSTFQPIPLRSRLYVPPWASSKCYPEENAVANNRRIVVPISSVLQLSRSNGLVLIIVELDFYDRQIFFLINRGAYLIFNLSQWDANWKIRIFYR